MNILLTGATGYIGKRLLPHLIETGHNVTCLVRDPRRFPESFADNKNIFLVKGDLLDEKSLEKIPTDLDVAFYFVHSMGVSNEEFSELEKKSAENFVRALDKTKTKQIIYLSGIINDEVSLSKHLSSRLNVEKILQTAKANTTILRAAIIIGSGSGSFEIIRDLAEKLPIMIAPKWLKTKCQPIAVKNVIEYLLGVIDKTESVNKVFDIGGPDVLTYKEMILGYAEARGLKRYIITIPILTPRLSSYWLYFVTSTNFKLARSLVESMKNEVVCKIEGIEKIVDTKLIGYKESIERAFKVIDANKVPSSWIDSAISGVLRQDFLDKIEVPKFGCLVDERIICYKIDTERVKKNIWEIGGDNGWYAWNWAWVVRGLLDKLFGGVGLRRGRRSPTELKPGDALDWWRVILANKSLGKIILYAEMKVPGEAWLELEVNEEKKSFTQKATFRPNGLLGRLYWYSLLPIHKIIFNGMANKIITKKMEYK
ncbi:MAG: SDR family oxidoreductase [Melioribacteraceae bacterium]